VFGIMSIAPQDPADDDVRAGEYVLGLLDPTEARALEAEAARRVSLAAAIAGWEQRLKPLLAQIPAVAPPVALWDRIQTSAFGNPSSVSTPLGANDAFSQRLAVKTRLWRSVPLWRAATAGFALAAAFAGVALLHKPDPSRLVAALLPPGQSGPVVVAQALSGGSVAIYPLGKIAAGDRHDLELWTLAKGAIKPVSLGIMPASGVVLAADAIPVEGQIMISVEPKGGSPTGLPTGPVVWAGTVGASTGKAPDL
jgi:anti-sigma-K factor RskA